MKKSFEVKKRVSLITIVAILIIVTIIPSMGAVRVSGEPSPAASSLSPEEVEKILNEIKVATKSGNAEAKLDELIQRAILTDNTLLKEYAEYSKQALQLESQLDVINASIKALCAKSPEISKINSTFNEKTKTDVSLSDIEKALPGSVKSILSGIDEKKLSALLSGINNIDKIKANPASLSETERNILGATVLQAAKNQGLLDENQIKEASKAIESVAAALKAGESSKYTGANRRKLISGSQEFARTANNAKAVLPEQVVLANTRFRLNSSPIMYNDQILISLNDILQFVKAEVQYTSNSGTLAIQTKDTMVEVTKGKNTGYVNDKSVSLPAPVLIFNGVTYISVEFFAQAFSVSYENFKDQGVFVMYGNFNQS